MLWVSIIPMFFCNIVSNLEENYEQETCKVVASNEDLNAHLISTSMFELHLTAHACFNSMCLCNLFDTLIKFFLHSRLNDRSAVDVKQC